MAIQQVLPFGNAAADLPRAAGDGAATRTGLRLYYSNRTERLLEELIANVEAAKRKPGASLFDAATIIVPNRQTETYLRFGIARATGIASNLRMPFLRAFLEGVITDCRPDFRIVSGRLLQGLVLTLLSDEALLGQDDFAPLRAYLLAAGPKADAVDLRRWQLSARIAHLFEEYGYSRPEMLEAWERDSVAGSGPERWQKRLWKELWSPKGLVATRAKAAAETWATMPAAFRPLSGQDLSGVLAPEIHVFGISSMARVFHEILASLARAADVNVYTINPCLEFREDVPASLGDGRRRFAARGRLPDPARLAAEEDPFELTQEAEAPALRLWGRPGRENVRLLHATSECECVPCFDDSPGREPTLLRQIQRDILVREPERATPAPGGDFEGDRSLAIFACPGIRREVETIAAEIWALVEEDGKKGAADGRAPLRFNDIAVILPASELATYQAHTASVFSETYEIPYNLVDLPLAAESRLVEAAGLLLSLAFSRFTRQDVLRVATHPCVIGRFADADPDEWTVWCDRLGIFHGADHDEHCGTYIERDLCNWDQGVKRLALGAFMAGRDSGDERVYEAGGQGYLPRETPQADLASVAGFAALVRSLIEDARFCRGRALAAADWIRFLQDLFQACLVPQHEEDERALMRCLAAVQSIEELDLGDRKIGYRIPYEHVTGVLSSLSGQRGQYLAGGVAVSSFLPMRAIPFRVIFVAGLGEGKFPAPDPADPLDLRHARRRAGDVSPRERDKAMFLETLLCARERLFLSYVARDALTGDAISPSSVIREMRHFLEREYLGPGGFDRLRRAPPLRRDEERADVLDRLAPAAFAESQARALGGHLREHLGKRPMPDLAGLRLGLAPENRALLGASLALALPDVPKTAPGSRNDRIALSISSLRRFLECALQGSASAFLKLREDGEEEDLLSREDEPLETEFIRRAMLLRSAFVEAVTSPAKAPGESAGDALARAYDRQAAVMELEGRLPTGPFAAAEREKHLAALRDWRAMYSQVAPEGSPLKIYRFGRADEHAVVDEISDPIVLEDVALGTRKVRIEIFGKTDPVIEAAPGSLLLFNHKANPIKRQRDCLRGFFDHLILAASGRRDRGPYRACLLLSDPENGGTHHVEVFDPISRGEARTYLETLCRELLSGGNDRLFPCEAVFELRASPSKSFREIVDKLRGEDFGLSFHYGPVPGARAYPAPGEEEARAAIERRFGLYFAKRRTGEPAR
ncbi:MAG TPA: exodeoxyribonuclease V subunit gamma [Thermoanaerobaculia bacterium]|nr:exodeoxyribonuclease V subunit gamma [Thermoanaerobaculia bacterium]